MSRAHVYVLVAALCAATGAIMYGKVKLLGIPLLPGQLEPVWAIEAKIEFDGRGRSTVVDFDIPDQIDGFLRLDEFFVSRNYGLNVEHNKRDRRAEWSTRRARGPQRLYYRFEVAPLDTDLATIETSPRIPKAPQRPAYEEPLASAIEDVLGEVRAESANVFTFVSRLLTALNVSDPDGNVMVIRGSIERGSEAWVERLMYVLAGARITTRMVRGIVLQDGVSNAELLPWLEVHNGTEWQGFDPLSGDKGYPEDFVRWTTGTNPLFTVENGRNPSVSFAISRYTRSLTAIARERAAASDTWLSNLLLFDLPVSTQNVYRILLMVPLGALIVAVMRTVVGIPTLGTFMPILVAIAFRETRLLWGILLFLLITTTGLALRFYLERLRLLLVPRLCCVLVLVVLLMLAISLASARLGFDQGFSIALFPIVIIAMAIEHLSVTWEESGAGAAFKEGLGSLVVASAGYLVMIDEHLTHLMFLFPELELAVLAVFLMLGRYTGYRVTEIFRFRDIVESHGPHVPPHP